jgi:hypothetical protein
MNHSNEKPIAKKRSHYKKVVVTLGVEPILVGRNFHPHLNMLASALGNPRFTKNKNKKKSYFVNHVYFVAEYINTHTGTIASSA